MRELDHHKEVAKWLKRKYPKLIFRTDYAAGLKLTTGQAKVHRSLQSGKSYPDLFIAKPVGPYHGLYIELKSDTEKLILNDGSFTKEKHIREQAVMLEQLMSQGYASTFAVGHQQAKNIIDNYLRGGHFMPIVPDESTSSPQPDDDDSPF